MQIILAKNAGFCYGVKKAVDTVDDLIKNKASANLYTIGKLIHNPLIINEQTKAGVTILPEYNPELQKEIKIISSNSNEEHQSYVVIRAHGIPKEEKEMLLNEEQNNKCFHVIDCTCPRVVKVQDIVEKNTLNGELAVIIGDCNHPEVKGIAGYAHNGYEIFENSEALERAIREQKTAMSNGQRSIVVSQTTYNLNDWKKSQLIIRKYFTNYQIFDTICNTTESRQNEAREMSRNVDIMVVVGGKESSNTNKLLSISNEEMKKRFVDNKTRAFLVETKKDLENIPIYQDGLIGITAGASTPSGIIQEVLHTMTDMEKNVGEISSEDFALMLESSLKPINSGETVKGIITSITTNEIYVDIGAKVTGIIPCTDIENGNLTKINEKYKVGDEIEAVVVKVSDLDGVATLSRQRIEASLNWNKIVAAKESGEIVEGKYLNPVKGGIIMVIDGQRVFVPATHTGLSKDADLSTLTGKTEKVKIIEVNTQRKRAVASARELLREERNQKVSAFWDAIEEGKEYDGIVKSITNYGAFVDLGGVDGMVHNSELTWKRIHNASEVVSVGEKIHVFVKSFDKETKKISLGCKTDETNPWNIFTSNYSIGDVVNVTIVNIREYGAFGEVVPGADGLIHISQIQKEKVAKVEDVLKLGQKVDAKITDIDFDEHKISLSMRALLPEDEVEEVEAEEAEATDAE